MSDLLERLRGRGWRMTSQRRVVAEVLDGDHVHLTADEVHTRAAQRLPEISRATVYNTLGELVSSVRSSRSPPTAAPSATTPTHTIRTSTWCAPTAAPSATSTRPAIRWPASRRWNGSALRCPRSRSPTAGCAPPAPDDLRSRRYARCQSAAGPSVVSVDARWAGHALRAPASWARERTSSFW